MGDGVVVEEGGVEAVETKTRRVFGEEDVGLEDGLGVGDGKPRSEMCR
jgi:hypothetical protein